ncbi:MAG: L,D-transpeptidase ErfK/SrfK [Blastocatellia bacterium]|jgi:lipoprotein-anchoring transpeptidase ErfK/SrfK|nr:L,D-transpeptidase ErfK/SrfK [Blastocatellia bacterium]
MKQRLGLLLSLAACLIAASCTEPSNQTNKNAVATVSPTATSLPTPADVEKASIAQPVTLPVLDAFFADESFSGLLKTRLQLTDDQIAKLKELAHAETAKLNEADPAMAEGGTTAARQSADEKLKALIGEEKTAQLTTLVRERWGETADSTASKTAVPTTNPTSPAEFAARPPNSVPTDSRIVVNAPAFRMDVFDGGRLVKSYKVGIGYPQFPLPTGLRKARTIIFNPTWTPPDEPWVAKMKNITVGEKVDAGSKLNPLGPIKIPIGLPSLIHGGKAPAKLGTFASHGCVGLTTPQIRDFAKVLAEIGGAKLNDVDLARYARDKTQTQTVKLGNDVPVELRYETIVAEDGKLHIYRDVYDQGTNTEANLRAVLDAMGVKFEDLTADELAQVTEALAQMSGKSGSRVAAASKATPSPLATPAASIAEGVKKTPPVKKPAATKNQKEIVIEIAALKGKGYPAAVSLDTGSGKAAPALASSKPAPSPAAKP